METYENTYVDFLTPQLGKVIIGVYSADVLLEFLATDSYKIFWSIEIKENHGVTLKFLCQWELMNHLKSCL